jgi:hypothetical protein
MRARFKRNMGKWPSQGTMREREVRSMSWSEATANVDIVVPLHSRKTANFMFDKVMLRDS